MSTYPAPPQAATTSAPPLGIYPGEPFLPTSNVPAPMAGTATIGASPWLRLGSYLLESVLISVTLGIGWVIWAAMTAGSGQTPAKKLLHLRVVDASTNQPVTLGKMFWMRGLLGGIVAALAIPVTIGILAFMPFWDKRNQNLWDKVSGTCVVNDA